MLFSCFGPLRLTEQKLDLFQSFSIVYFKVPSKVFISGVIRVISLMAMIGSKRLLGLNGTMFLSDKNEAVTKLLWPILGVGGKIPFRIWTFLANHVGLSILKLKFDLSKEKFKIGDTESGDAPSVGIPRGRVRVLFSVTSARSVSMRYAFRILEKKLDG
ncbi:hypothetical protein Tco_1225872 [Tanacetum coccineum]